MMPAVRGASEARGGVAQDLALQLISGQTLEWGKRCVGPAVRGTSGAWGQRCMRPVVRGANGEWGQRSARGGVAQDLALQLIDARELTRWAYALGLICEG